MDKIRLFGGKYDGFRLQLGDSQQLVIVVNGELYTEHVERRVDPEGFRVFNAVGKNGV